MKNKVLPKILILLLTSFPVGYLHSQVTIGNNIAAEKGALLQLRDGTVNAANSLVNAKAGLALPRVMLTDLDNLYPMLTGSEADYTAKKVANIGLLVYNNNKCIGLGKGLYLWDGSQWQTLNKTNTFVSPLSQTYFDLHSGQDARGTVSPLELIVTWSGATPATWSTAADAQLNAVGLSNPVTTGTVGTSPHKMSIAHVAMDTTAEVTDTAPWYSKQTKLTFANLVSDCGQQTYVTLNQTNYALKVNNSFTNSTIVYTSLNSKAFTVQGNASWTTRLNDPNGILTTATSPAIGITSGADIKNYPIAALNSVSFRYTPNAGQKYCTANITFSDVASVKRFNDITVSILNCTNVNEPNMSQWAARAGFAGVAITKVSDADDLAKGIDTPNSTTGIAWHRDQDGNIFLSGRFGYEDPATNTQERRWMITNLAATTYASSATPSSRTGQDKYFKSNPVGPNAEKNYASPLWCYPKTPTTATTYINNPRIGLLYNWAAATNSHGRYNLAGTTDNSTGTATLVEIETAAGDDPTPRIQGICPNGWHLPSDREWTALEQEISDNISLYSGLPNNPITIELNATNYRSSKSTQGAAMKDACSAPTMTSPATNGSSNLPSTELLGGFGVMLIGYAYGSSSYYYGSYGYFLSASGIKAASAQYRSFGSSYSSVYRKSVDRCYLFSLRCKKDN